MAGLIDVHGKLYGTTNQGGKYNAGTVFSITRPGREKILYSFGAIRMARPPMRVCST